MARPFIAGAALAAMAFGPAAAQTQNGPQIFQSWLGKTLDLEYPDGRKGELHFTAGGAVKVSGTFSDTGKWRVTDDGYCVTWTKIRDGREACLVIVTWGAQFHTVLKGTNTITGTVTPR